MASRSIARERHVLGAGRRDRHRRHRRDQHPRQHPEADPPLPPPRQFRAGRRWSACSRTSIRARSTSRGPLRAAGVQVAIGGFHVSGCLSMLDGKAIDLDLARDLGISIFAGEAEERLEACCATPRKGALKPLYNFMNDLPSIGGTPMPFLPQQCVQAHRRHQYQLRCRPRLPVPVLVLHHHQRAGPQVALPLARRRRADRPRQLRPGHHPLLHHRRQLRPQQGLGGDLRPARQAARGRQDPARADDPGGHDVPPDPELHREGASGPASRACSSGWRTSIPTT